MRSGRRRRASSSGPEPASLEGGGGSGSREGKREREGELTRRRETRACPQVPSRSRPWSATSAPYNDPTSRGAGGPPLEEERRGGERERGLGRRGTRSWERRNAGPGDGRRRPRSEAAVGLVVSWGLVVPARRTRASAGAGGGPRSAWTSHVSRVSQALKQRGLVSPGGPSPAGSLPPPPPLSPRAPSARGVTEAPLTRSGPAADRRSRFSRPGMGTRGLWQGAWRPLQVGRPPWSDRGLPPPPPSGAASILVLAALEPWGVVKPEGWTAATAAASAC